jgi:urease accessory protein
VEVLSESGAGRVRFPKTAAAEPCEAVLLNTAGGLTGGDRLEIAVALGAGANAVLTTAAAEKIYRSREGDAAVRVALSVAGSGQLAWLPQPTILFDRARLDRATLIELSAEATFLAVEILIFGRTAMGESVRQGGVRDSWRLTRAGAVALCDSFHLEGRIAEALARPATLGGATATGLLVYAASCATGRIDQARAIVASFASVAGVSAYNGLLVARAVAQDGQTLKSDLGRLIEGLYGRPLPRLWNC